MATKEINWNVEVFLKHLSIKPPKKMMVFDHLHGICLHALPPPPWERQLYCTGLVLDWNMCQNPVKTMRTTSMWSCILHIRRQTHNTKKAKGNYFTTSNVESSVRDRNTNASESIQQCLRQCKHTIDVFRRFGLGWDTVVSCSLYGCRSQHSSGWQSALATAWVQTCWLEFWWISHGISQTDETSRNRNHSNLGFNWPSVHLTCFRHAENGERLHWEFQYWEFKGLHNRLTHANTQNWSNWKRHFSCSTQQALQQRIVVPYCFLSMFHWVMFGRHGGYNWFFCSTLSTQSAGAGICLSGCTISEHGILHG